MASKYLPIRDAVREVLGVCPAKSTIQRWTGPGVGGKRLDSVLIGGRRCATVDAVRAFMRHDRPVQAVERSQVDVVLGLD